jgi:type VI secretion system protein ImpC
MANRSFSTTVEIDINPYDIEAEREPLLELDAPSPLRLLVLGDFSGKATGKLVRVDGDNFESIFHGFAPHVELALGNGQLGDADLVFRSLSDFEPDSIYRQSELFAPLRDHMGQALYSEREESAEHEPLKPTTEQMQKLTSPGGLLDAIVERTSSTGGGSAAAPAPQRMDEFQSMVSRIVAPYSTPAESVESQRAAAERAQRLSLLMAQILHDEQFQALEAAWRGLDLLVRGLDTDHQVHLYLFDISKEKLAEELKATGDIRATGIFRALIEGAAGQWGLLAGNLSFDRDVIGDVELLERMSVLARAVGAPFIAEWLTSRQENSKAQAAWQALRRSAAASYLGLALPRFLLRLPYGKGTTPVEGFDFEEMTGEPVHSEYLWGNPAFACALVLGQLFEQQGSLQEVPGFLRLGGLPLHTFELDGETRARPCTEVLLSDHDCQTLLEEGVLPLVAVKSSDTVVFPKMQSIADPAAGLAGFEMAGWLTDT